MAETETQDPPNATNGEHPDPANPVPTGVPVFDIETPPVPFQIREKGGNLVDYELRQFQLDNGKNNGGGLATWFREVGRRNETDDNGKVVSTNWNGFHESMITLCCYRKGAEELTPKYEIAKWPSKAKMWAFAECQRINGMKEEQKVAQGKV